VNAGTARPDATAPFEQITHPSGERHYGEFVVSGGERLYAASYLPKREPVVGVVLCPSWGVESARQVDWTHRFAHDLASRGAAAVLVQWPGTEDSEGDPAAVTVDRLVEAGVDTSNALLARCGPTPLCVVGTRVGAAPAVLIADAFEGSSLVLVQPELDLPTYFAEQERMSRRGRLGAGSAPDWAFGWPAPRGLRRDEDHERVVDALRGLGRRATVVRYRRRPEHADPDGARVVRVWGEWTTSAAVEHPSLRVAAARLIMRSAKRNR